MDIYVAITLEGRKRKRKNMRNKKNKFCIYLKIKIKNFSENFIS